MDGFLEKFKFLAVGALSGSCAITVTFPFDSLKVHVQMENEKICKEGHPHLINPLQVAKNLYRERGIRVFYQGIDSAYFKQITFTCTRLGAYKYLYETGIREHGTVSFGWKMAYATTAAVLASIVGNPADLAMVRFQSDASLPLDQRRNYRHVFQAFGCIIKKEGVAALWRGTLPLIVRIVAINNTQLTTFDEFKERTRKFRGGTDDIWNRAAAASLSGVICACLSLPFDNVKVKYQRMQRLPDGTWPYRHLGDVFVKTFRREGLSGFWSGLPVFYMLIGPHTFISLLAQDYFHVALSKRTLK